LLVLTNHVGRVNNGLLAVWQRANDQGAWDMGFRPVDDLKVAIRAAKVLYVAGADPAGDDPDLAESGDFMVVQDLYLTQTAKLADVVLPAQAFTEREGSYTSAERRVQRFYPAVPEASGTFPDFAIAGRIGKRLGLDMEERLASKVMARIAETVPDYAQVSFARLAEVKQQWPLIGREDLYYGGTSYENSQGLGLQLAPATQKGAAISLGWIEPPVLEMPPEGLIGVPITRLYDHGLTLLPSKLLEQRIPEPYALLNPGDAGRLGIFEGALIQVSFNGANALVSARLDENTPAGAVLLPRSFGFPINAPTAVAVRVVEQMAV
jgi:NADH-quinone oxidoreductase subunit G